MGELVAVGMSGGVDSSVAAVLLLGQGLDVVGVTMRLGLAEASGRACCGEQDALDARSVCDTLGIRHVVLDMSEEFTGAVLGPYGDALQAGTTPNPCVWCNEHVKFGALIGRVRRLGIERLATGHYARILPGETGPVLVRGIDAEKDQSYFLYRVRPAMLEYALFPLGRLQKPAVRAIAAAHGLAVATRHDSQDLCFAAERDDILRAAHPQLFEPGVLVTREGVVLGAHRGLANYTVGQRRGLGISGIAPHVVVALEPAANAVILAPAAEAHVDAVVLIDPIWHLPDPVADVLVQTRHRATPAPARAERTAVGIDVRFEHETALIAPGQSVVLYHGDVIVGGGIVRGGA